MVCCVSFDAVVRCSVLLFVDDRVLCVVCCWLCVVCCLYVVVLGLLFAIRYVLSVVCC